MRSFEQLAAPPQQTLAPLAFHAPTVGVDRRLTFAPEISIAIRGCQETTQQNNYAGHVWQWLDHSCPACGIFKF
jgi:hypothetical protein